jgi:RNA polymerase sigma-70 factor, ECF subfamily
MKPIGKPQTRLMDDAGSAASQPQPISQELLARFVTGDREAFGDIFDRVQKDIFYIVRRFFSGAFDQEEAMQEVWLRLYCMRDRFDVNRVAEFVPWSRQVARNLCIDLLKKRGRSHEVSVEDFDRLPREPAQFGAVTDTRLRQALAEFVSRLDREEQHFFELCFVRELPHEEIAEAMSITIRRSKYLKKKLLARLMKNTTLRAALEG